MKIKIKILFYFFAVTCLAVTHLGVTGGVFAQETDSLKINYNYINSSPQNAEVIMNGELIGYTPLFFMWQDSVFPKTLKLKLKGYADYVESIPSGSLFDKTYSLVPVNGKKPDLVKEDKATYFNKPRKIIPIVLSSAAVIGAGISAYYFKSLAIENRDEYDITGDPAALDRKRKYDVISGVSLAVLQVGFGALIYFLFIDN